jgi:hypothetical protein
MFNIPQMVQTSYDLIFKTHENISNIWQMWSEPDKLDLGKWDIVINEATNYSILN